MSFITIKNYYGNKVEVEVTEEVYKAWHELYAEERNLQEREKYHRAPCLLENCSEASIHSFIVEEEDPEDELVRLYRAIDKLNPTQKRRIQMYLKNMKPAEIARAEKRAMSTVTESLEQAIITLRKIMLNE